MASTKSRKPGTPKASKEATPGPGELEHQLYKRIAQILEETRGQVARTVNTAMVHAYWHIGREIVAVTQEGEARARYGNEVVKNLAKRLQRSYGKGFSLASLFRMRQFYLAFPNGSTIRGRRERFSQHR